MPPVFPTPQLAAPASLDHESHSPAPYLPGFYPYSKAMANVPPEASWVPPPGKTPLARMLQGTWYTALYTHRAPVM